MTRLVDVVNFNADASCFSAEGWLSALEGGAASRLCGWLNLFVTMERKVTLGIVGGALADMARFNPESIALLNANPDVFEVILRPFSHDVALLRTPRGFELNVRLGREIIERELRSVTPYFLPPEFMLTNGHVKQLADLGIEGTFINPRRFDESLQKRIPPYPYMVKGVLGASLRCFPTVGALTELYLDALHTWDAGPYHWAVAGAGRTGDDVVSWRDGESPFLIPEGLDRERAWLEQQPDVVRRAHLREVLEGTRFRADAELPEPMYRSYPVHSFTAWFREFRMLGFLERLRRVEDRLPGLPRPLAIIWLQAINSDVLSAVEKRSPVVRLRAREPGPAGGVETSFTILRSERGFEGEEWLAVLEALLDAPPGARGPWDALRASTEPHMRKLVARLDYFDRPPGVVA